MEPTATDFDFTLAVPLRAWTAKGGAAEGGRSMRIGGIVSTDVLDRQQERVIQDGLDFTEFMAFGWFNDNHKQGSDDILGHPTGVKRVKPGDKLPDGTMSTVNGWWADGYLLDTTRGRTIWENIKALEGTGRSLGYSIEGSVVARSGKSTISRAKIRNVAITQCPVNFETNMVALAKAMMAGGAVEAPATATPGDGFALRTESGITKPKMDDIPVATDLDLVESWADTLAAMDIDVEDDVKLNKAEAAIVVGVWHPDLTGSERDRVISRLAAA